MKFSSEGTLPPDFEKQAEQRINSRFIMYVLEFTIWH